MQKVDAILEIPATREWSYSRITYAAAIEVKYSQRLYRPLQI